MHRNAPRVDGQQPRLPSNDRLDTPISPVPVDGPVSQAHPRGRGREQGGSRVRGGGARGAGREDQRSLGSAAANIKPTSPSLSKPISFSLHPPQLQPSSQTLHTTTKPHKSAIMVVYIAAFGANSAVGGTVKEALLPEYESMFPSSPL